MALYEAAPAEDRGSRDFALNYGEALYEAGRWAEAESHYRSVGDSLQNTWNVRGHLGVLAGRRGDRVEAMRHSEWFEAQAGAFSQGLHTFWRVRIAASLGDRVRADQLFRQALDEGLPFAIWLHNRPALRALQGYAPFDDIMRPKG